ncbi:glycoside hydrolase family 17 protein [Trichoderma atroviride IMI 206040]|uniref:Glycoside hydrolase family 17 protein n=1 Tax=Hypocrea atroviridis (strain ATCC 20476 / IMI 206040) TaxID=452589 RepID=G9NNS5_HYPAI|nr:glycoside hydrolase family 17 protein [Trichoderma atroviride IMI 206040]EHK47716.1 glycoside hydrolase family 17 protein [Trichoderma atroviride IMI 206040]
MKLTSTIAAGAALAAGVSAGQNNYLGFNSGATLPDESAKFEKDFLAEFTTAQKLPGAPGTFNAVRLYTNIQAYSTNTPIEAFSAAIKTKTKILLGVWASGTANINNELAALSAAVKQYGSDFTDLIIGISIGSEDLYRDSATGRTNKAGVGNGPDEILSFINAYKKEFANTALSSVPVGHVDTWDAWVNGTNKEVLDAVDWIGVDEYPFYETGKGNNIDNAGKLFNSAYQTTLGVANGKPVWVTETGWPLTGPSWDEAVPSVENAKSYWDQVGCEILFNKVPTFWYNLRDSNPANTVKFGVNQKLDGTPSFNLTCPAVSKSISSSITKPTATGKGSTPSTLVTAPSQTAQSGANNAGSAKGADSSSDSSASKTSSSPASTSSHSAGSINKVSGAAFAGVALVAGIFATLF